MNHKVKISLLLLALLAGCRKKDVKPQEPNYTNFKVLKLTVSKIPFLNMSNDDWDIFDGPDVFFNMESTGGTVLYTSSRFTDVVTSDLPLKWEFIPAYEITNIGAIQFVTIYDFDTFDPNDEIGYVPFLLSDHKSGYPKTISKTQDGISVTITGEWY